MSSIKLRYLQTMRKNLQKLPTSGRKLPVSGEINETEESLSCPLQSLLYCLQVGTIRTEISPMVWREKIKVSLRPFLPDFR